MANYQKASVKLTNTIKQIKTCSKNKTRTILRLNKENYEYEELPHELFLTTKQLK